MTRHDSARQRRYTVLVRRRALGAVAAPALCAGALAVALVAPAPAGASSLRTMAHDTSASRADNAGVAATGVAATATPQAKSLVVATVTTAELGTILAVGGRTVYQLVGKNASCAGACVQVWPEVLLPKGAARPTAGKGVSAPKLGTVARSGGTRQVTYAGHALYFFRGDTRSGQASGNGVKGSGGTWQVVVLKKPAPKHGTETTTTLANGGYSY
ncbi:MAG TPA: hypothetical protein VMD59_16060 [Acidimicrobiales bacterium]|nr:hypothetical protein [Acidimicrobiales bacterium]